MPDDAAFLWETAALRSRKTAGIPDAAPRRDGDEQADWATLREAHEESGVPMSTCLLYTSDAADDQGLV